MNATLLASRVERAWTALDAVPDPKVPALSVRDLGIVREVLARADDAQSGVTDFLGISPLARVGEGIAQIGIVLMAVDSHQLVVKRLAIQKKPGCATKV